MGIGRRRGRILAFQALYAWDLAGVSPEMLAKFDWFERKSSLSDSDLLFPRLLFLGAVENIEKVDSCIIKRLENWDFLRLKKVDKAILRLSVYSLLFQKEIPATVVINEAVSLANDYGTDDSFKFVNGILDNIAKTI